MAHDPVVKDLFYQEQISCSSFLSKVIDLKIKLKPKDSNFFQLTGHIYSVQISKPGQTSYNGESIR